MTKTYSLKALRPLLSMTRPAPPLLGSFDRFEDGIIRWIADAAGLWLHVNDNHPFGGVLSVHEMEGLSGFNPDDLEISYMDGVGHRYGLPGMRPILPFPFTVMQLFEFDKQAGGLVRENFYIDAKEAEEQLTELEQTNPEAAELARIIFSGVMPEQHPTTPSPAPVVAAGASDTQATQGNIMKKIALIAALKHEWPSIEADISEATRNGLKAAAHTGEHGEWDADKARAWAVSKSKIKQTAPVHSLAAAWPGATTRNTISR